jgi:rhodanese-related sulfurtransferase
MSSPTEITVPQLSRIIGLPGAPLLIDVRLRGGCELDRRLLPTAQHLDFNTVSTWADSRRGQRIVVYCLDGGEISRGTAAWLRQAGGEVQVLQGGFEAWQTARQPLLCADRLPDRDDAGRTTWVTRARPKVTRIACPWLIRRFVDPKAVILFVPPSDVSAVASRFNATPFDSGQGIWSDRANACTFDIMLEEFGLRTEPLTHLAMIIRGADTGQLDLTLQSAGLLATSLGFSRMYRDDQAQLDATLPTYDALYRWCRDGTEETHG